MSRPSCDGCMTSTLYEMHRERRSKAGKLAREAYREAKRRKVDVGMLIAELANCHACGEASHAEGEAARSSYAEGYSDGFREAVDA